MPYTNKLYLVDDEIHPNAYLGDIDDQGTFNSNTSTINTANNYGYDKLGNLIRDNAEEIASIQWNVTGKIQRITRSTGSKKADLVYGYDASGTRLFKVVIPKQQTGASTGTRMSQEHWDTTWYIKDASGNAMATYKTTHTRIYTAQPQNSTLKKQFFTEELYIYGSNRHGVLKASDLLSEKEYALSLGQYVVPDSTFPQVQEGVFETIGSTQTITVNYEQGQFTFVRGYKQYELSNHLGNVLVTIQDRKWGIQTTGGNNANYYLPYIITTSDYYAFGSSMVERSQSFGEIYKFGFNNQEKEGDPDSNREGDYYSFEYRIHDSRLGRFLSVDPLSPEYPWNSCYAFAENRVIDCLDLEGLEAASGTVMITGGDGAVKSPNQHTVYGKTTANQRLNQQSFLQSELNRLTGSEWKPANGKYDKNWFENVYKPNAQAINAFLDKPASTIINNPTQSTSTVTSTPTTAASTSTTTTATSPNPTSVATSSSVSTSTTTTAVTGDPISSTVSSVSSKVSTAGVVLGAVETVDRIGYVTSAGKLKSFGSSSTKLLVNPKIVEMKSIGKLSYIKDISLSELNKTKLTGGPQKVIGSALGRTGLSIGVGKYMGPIGVGVSFVNMFAEPTAKNVVGFVFDASAYVVGIGCPPLGFAISAIGWVTSQVWTEPEKPVVKKTPSPLYPSTTKPLNFSTSTSVSPTYMYTPSRIRRMPSDHMNPYSPAGGY